jgi:hypothetical protein
VAVAELLLLVDAEDGTGHRRHDSARPEDNAECDGGSHAITSVLRRNIRRPDFLEQFGIASEAPQIRVRRTPSRPAALQAAPGVINATVDDELYSLPLGFNQELSLTTYLLALRAALLPDTKPVGVACRGHCPGTLRDLGLQAYAAAAQQPAAVFCGVKSSTDVEAAAEAEAQAAAWMYAASDPSKLPVILVIGDGAVIPRHFHKKLSAVAAAAAASTVAWDLLLIGTGRSKYRPDTLGWLPVGPQVDSESDEGDSTPPRKVSLHKIAGSQPLPGVSGYLLSAAGAEKLLSQLPVRISVRSWLGQLAGVGEGAGEPRLQILAVWPPLLAHESQHGVRKSSTEA